MNRHPLQTSITTLIVALAASAVAVTEVAASPPPPPGGSLAQFEGEIIDLSQSWGDAQACLIGDDGNHCFRTTEEREAFVASQPQPRASCSNYLYLYDGTNRTGSNVGLAQRGVGIDLGPYGFAGRTSSYEIGPCNSALRDSSLNIYPGNTSAGAWANSMASGWNNRVASVVIA